MKTAIAYVYRCVMNAPPPTEWDGVDGTITAIQNHLKIDRKKRRTIKSVLEQCEKCIANNVSFSPVVQIQEGRPTIIKKRFI